MLSYTTLSWSSNGGLTGEKYKVSCVLQENQIAYIWSRGPGNGATGVHRAFSDRYQGESIEHSLMDPPEGRRSTKSCGIGRKLLLGQDRTWTSPSSMPPSAGGGQSCGLGRKLLLGQDRTWTSPSSVPPSAGGGVPTSWGRRRFFESQGCS